MAGVAASERGGRATFGQLLTIRSALWVTAYEGEADVDSKKHDHSK